MIAKIKYIFNVWFEKLHRYVYDHVYQSTNPDWGYPIRYNDANRHNKYQRFNNQIDWLYSFLCPFFKGWRFDLKIHNIYNKRYLRYEPKKLDLMKYEIDQLSKSNKIKYLELLEIQEFYKKKYSLKKEVRKGD
jgi:hypothetical protein